MAIGYWLSIDVMLNSVQHLSAERGRRYTSRRAVRSWTKLFAFAHRKYLLFVRIRYGQHDNIATLKHIIPPRKVGFCASKGLFLPLKTPFFGAFLGCFTGFYKTQNFMLLNISALCAILCVLCFCVLQTRYCFRSAVETVSLRSLARSFVFYFSFWPLVVSSLYCHAELVSASVRGQRHV